MSARIGLVAAACGFAALLAGWWWLGSVEFPDRGAVGERPVAVETTAARSAELPDTGAIVPSPGQGVVAALPDDAGSEDVTDDESRFWESVKRYCPWPPDPSSWQVLDEPCLSVMNRRELDEMWRLALDHPLAAWRAASAALADPECDVPEGQIRPDLYEACAADAIIRIAALQFKCAERVRQDPEGIFDHGSRMDDMADDQEEFHRWAEDTHRSRAHAFWTIYTCRTVPREALDWIAAIPEPEDVRLPWVRTGSGKKAMPLEYEDGSGGVMTDFVVTSQHADLY